MRRVIGILGVKGAGKDTCASILMAERNYKRIAFADALYEEVSIAYCTPATTFSNRATKETPLPQLALKNCRNMEFVEVALLLLTHDKKLRKAVISYLLNGNIEQGVSSRRVKTLAKAPRSPRWVMQTWGTEYRRRSRYGIDSYWVDLVNDHLKQNPDVNFVITDVRFQNEANVVKEYSGKLIRVRRASLEALEELDRNVKGTAAHCSETEALSICVDFEVFNEEGKADAMFAQIRSIESSQVSHR